METHEKLLKKIAEGRQYRQMAELLRIGVGHAKDDAAGTDSAGDERMVVEGHATTFGQPYNLYEDDEFRIDEMVDAGAFEGCDMSDVIFQYDHCGRVFARTRNGTLEVAPDDTGLYIKADLGGTEEGRKLYQEIRDGYTDRMSFGFTITGDKVEQTQENGKTLLLRTITKVGKLYDVSAVSIPANDGTDISARSYSDGLIARLKAERLEKRAELETAKAKALAILAL